MRIPFCLYTCTREELDSYASYEFLIQIFYQSPHVVEHKPGACASSAHNTVGGGFAHLEDDNLTKTGNTEVTDCCTKQTAFIVT